MARKKAKPPVEAAPKAEEAEDKLEQGAEGENEGEEGEGDESDPETEGDEAEEGEDGEETEDGEEEGADPADGKEVSPAIKPAEAKSKPGNLTRGEQVPIAVLHMMNTQGMSLAQAMKVHNAKVEQGE